MVAHCSHQKTDIKYQIKVKMYYIEILKKLKTNIVTNFLKKNLKK